MEENKINSITLNGNAKYTFNLNFGTLKKIPSRIFLAIVLLHPIMINLGDNYYQTGKVVIEKPNSQSIDSANAPNIKKKLPIAARKRKKHRLTCGK
jgi:hypothetical protein